MSEAVAEGEQARRADAPVDAAKDTSARAEGLAKSLAVERSYTPDREAMLAALRVALGLPKALPSRQEGWQA